MLWVLVFYIWPRYMMIHAYPPACVNWMSWMSMLPASTTSFRKIGNSSVCNLRTYPNCISSCIFLCIVQNTHVPKCVSHGWCDVAVLWHTKALGMGDTFWFLGRIFLGLNIIDHGVPIRYRYVNVCIYIYIYLAASSSIYVHAEARCESGSCFSH